MEQFDKAVAVDRQDPLAYHLISEVLVSKGLYRSALPLLRKAVALSPVTSR
jgi:Tfp pilus assembly protein PilF